MVSSFHPHSMCNKVEMVTAKTGCTSCTKRTISFEVSGFHTETRLLQRDFIFLNLFELQTFCVFKMHHSKPHHQFSTLCDFICYFSCIYWFFLSYKTQKLKSTTNELWKGWKLAWCHHFTNIACAKMQCYLVARHYICELCNAMLFSQASYMWIISCRPSFVFLVAFVDNVCIFNCSSCASAIWIGDGEIWSENKVFRVDNATCWSRHLAGYR